MDGYDLIAHCMKAEGVTWMPCFPANPLIEAAARVGIRPLVFRQERGGINAADGYARQTRGAPPAVFASQSGPGVENSFGGIRAGVGRGRADGVSAGRRGVEAATTWRRDFSRNEELRLHYQAGALIDRIDRVATQIRRAFHTARPRPAGAVVVEMHGDVLGKEVPDGAAERYRPSTLMRSVPSNGDIKDAVKALLGAKRPLIWAGHGGSSTTDATEELRMLAELLQVPVVTTMPGKSAFQTITPWRSAPPTARHLKPSTSGSAYRTLYSPWVPALPAPASGCRFQRASSSFIPHRPPRTSTKTTRQMSAWSATPSSPCRPCLRKRRRRWRGWPRRRRLHRAGNRRHQA